MKRFFINLYCNFIINKKKRDKIRAVLLNQDNVVTPQRDSNLAEQLQYMKEHCDIFHLKPATGELRQQQLRLLDFAKEFLHWVEPLKIKPFLSGGNLLGALRHHGFIPWDDDMDFYLMRSDYEKLIKWCEQHGVVCFYHGKNSEYGAYEVAERLHDRVVISGTSSVKKPERMRMPWGARCCT